MKSNSRNWEDLPDYIIQQIQCFLWDDYYGGEAAKDRSVVALIRTSSLSKSWLKASSTSPALCFQHLRYGGRSYLDEDKFVKLVDDTLLRYHHHNLLIGKLRLVLREKLGSNLVSSSINKWLKISSQSGLMDLDLIITQYSTTLVQWRYTLSHEFLDTKSVRTLKLSGDIEFPRCYDDVIISCHSLVYVNLYGVKIDEQVIQKLFYKCPLIHTFILYECKGFKSIRLANALHLRKFGFSTIEDGTVEFVDAPNICSFVYFGLYLKNIKITFDSLVKLTIRRCLGIMEVNIKAPKLFYFNYSGKMSVFSGINDCPRQLKKMNLCIEESVNLDTSWFLRLQEVLKKSCESDVSVMTGRNMGLSIDFDIHALRAASFQPQGVVKLEFDSAMWLSTSTTLVDAFLFAFRPKYFTPKNSLFKNLLGRTNANGCTCDETTCWHHYLEDVKTGCWKPYNAEDSREDDEFGWRPMSIPRQHTVGYYNGQYVTFKLDWI